MSTAAGQGDMVERLNTLLEAERAGAKVLTEFAATAQDGELGELFARVQRDEARYCALLTRMIRAAGGEPSSKTGAFREKVMALDTIESRLELLNRGQGWVAKRIDELLPSVTDPGFQAELVEMRERHHANIAACEAALQRLRAAGT